MKKSLAMLGLAGLLTAAPLVSADTILGIYAGAGVWKTDFSGEIGDTGLASADLEDLGLSDEQNSFYYVALEHPVPVIPNIRLQINDINLSESSTITQSFVLDGTTYNVSDDVTSDFDLSHTDATLYYEILDNWLTADLGLTIRQFDGSLHVSSSSSGSVTQTIDETIPMAYLKGQVELPFTGFYVTAIGNFISYDGNTLKELQAGVGYLSDGWVLDLGFEVGLKSMKLELDDVSDIDANIDLSGAYASFNLHF
ncbi:MAG: TIGR04219 family outer membrane beta-barrel protein [Cellvibrionaceae bacterium]